MSNPTGLDAFSSGQIYRKDFPSVLACDRYLAVIRPVRVPYVSGGYSAGTVLAQYTSGAASGQFPAYANSGPSGSGTAQCILFESIDDDGATGTILARAIFSGIVFQAKCSLLDSTAISNLGGRSWTDAQGVQIFKF
jgi:hypothetical protein